MQPSLFAYKERVNNLLRNSHGLDDAQISELTLRYRTIINRVWHNVTAEYVADHVAASANHEHSEEAWGAYLDELDRIYQTIADAKKLPEITGNKPAEICRRCNLFKYVGEPCKCEHEATA